MTFTTARIICELIVVCTLLALICTELMLQLNDWNMKTLVHYWQNRYVHMWSELCCCYLRVFGLFIIDRV